MRTDELGRAYAGSQLQSQIYVARRQKELSQSVLVALREIGEQFTTVHWVAPLESDKFYEPRDGAFLQRVGLSGFRRQLSDFWPTRGPRWDGLAVLGPGKAILLVEGKSYPAELLGGGCKARDPARLSIRKSLDAAKARFNVDSTVDWLGPLYQYANRLSHVQFLRNECGTSAFLANLCFVDDPIRPTSEDVWKSQLKAIKAQLGFASNIPHTVNIFLKAHPRQQLL